MLWAKNLRHFMGEHVFSQTAIAHLAEQLIMDQ